MFSYTIHTTPNTSPVHFIGRGSRDRFTGKIYGHMHHVAVCLTGAGGGLRLPTCNSVGQSVFVSPQLGRVGVVGALCGAPVNPNAPFVFDR